MWCRLLIGWRSMGPACEYLIKGQRDRPVVVGGQPNGRVN